MEPNLSAKYSLSFKLQAYINYWMYQASNILMEDAINKVCIIFEMCLNSIKNLHMGRGSENMEWKQ